MKGITNAPQGSGGGSGGVWTQRTANNDWTDLIEVSGNKMTAKKNIFFTYTTSSFNSKQIVSAFLPKGFSSNNIMSIPIVGSKDNSGNFFIIESHIEIAKSAIPSSVTNVSKNNMKIALTTDGSTITVTPSNDVVNMPKSDFIIWTSE